MLHPFTLCILLFFMNYYLERFAYREQLIDALPKEEVSIIIVIPCSNESNLLNTLESIYNCEIPQGKVEIIVVINASETATIKVINQNKKTIEEGGKWIKENEKTFINTYFIEENTLPQKHAGVGLARKIGMDEAVRRFEYINKPKGIILCFDADATCEKNYLLEVEKHFKYYSKSPACSIHFEHPTFGTSFNAEIYDGIIQYELHLRYYKNGLSYAKLPYAFHTIGSSMAVLNDAYQKQNGMNKRKAGEDFYFLQKLIPLGGFTELKTTKVIPSPRVSDRVPFGTGRAMQEWLNNEEQQMLTYNIKSFIDLKHFVGVVPKIYTSSEVDIPKSVNSYLDTISFKENVLKIRRNSTSEKHFKHLFFNWFNAFKVLKYMHFARDYFYEDKPIVESANKMLALLYAQKQPDALSLLEEYRKIDLSN